MECPFCSNEDTKVLESRIAEGTVRRRRECLKCENRFTTYETAVFQLTVMKKDGREQPFQAEKIATSINRACSKADPVALQDLSRTIEQKLLSKKKNMLTTKEIGRVVLQELRKFDKIAYVRFASIHKGIDDPLLLKKEVSLLAKVS